MKPTTFKNLYERAVELKSQVPEDLCELNDVMKLEVIFSAQSIIVDFIEAFEHETLMELCDL